MQGGRSLRLSARRYSDRPSVRGVAEAGKPQFGPADRDDPERNGRRFGFRARFAQIARALPLSSGVSERAVSRRKGRVLFCAHSCRMAVCDNDSLDFRLEKLISESKMRVCPCYL